MKQSLTIAKNKDAISTAVSALIDLSELIGWGGQRFMRGGSGLRGRSDTTNRQLPFENIVAADKSGMEVEYLVERMGQGCECAKQLVDRLPVVLHAKLSELGHSLLSLPTGVVSETGSSE
jgi:hypothetical protein